MMPQYPRPWTLIELPDRSLAAYPKKGPYLLGHFIAKAYKDLSAKALKGDLFCPLFDRITNQDLAHKCATSFVMGGKDLPEDPDFTYTVRRTDEGLAMRLLQGNEPLFEGTMDDFRAWCKERMA